MSCTNILFWNWLSTLWLLEKVGLSTLIRHWSIFFTDRFIPLPKKDLDNNVYQRDTDNIYLVLFISKVSYFIQERGKGIHARDIMVCPWDWKNICSGQIKEEERCDTIERHLRNNIDCCGTHHTPVKRNPFF